MTTYTPKRENGVLTGDCAVGVVMDFLDAWRFCPVSSAANASHDCLENAARQLLTALTAALNPDTPTTPRLLRRFRVMSNNTRQERTHLRDAYQELARADWHLACAAARLEDAHRPGWAKTADDLMGGCVTLREAIHKAEQL